MASVVDDLAQRPLVGPRVVGHYPFDVVVTVPVGATPIQAGFRVAFEIPAVGQVAVGVSQAEHLCQLLAARSLRPDPDQLVAYRSLLARRASTITG